MCQRARDWIAARAASGAIDLMPCQDPARPARAPQVSAAACMEAMQLVTADGRVFAGERAVPLILSATPGYRWLGALMRIPGVLLLARPVYALIARNRLAISALFIKRAPGESCAIDKDCG